jgi:hypothetical protein
MAWCAASGRMAAANPPESRPRDCRDGRKDSGHQDFDSWHQHLVIAFHCLAFSGCSAGQAKS